MSFVYIAPLADCSAFKVGKAVAPSSRISQLLCFYEFTLEKIVIVACGTEEDSFNLESILHKACGDQRVIQPFDGGTEFFAYPLFEEVLNIVGAVCRMRNYKQVPFVRAPAENPIDETALIVRSFAVKVRARRLEMNMRQVDVARIAMVSKRTVERIESTGQATIHNLVAVLRALNLEHLLAGLEMGETLRKRSRIPRKPAAEEKRSTQ
jgi:DNA-binding XRE family transcriptional regulator